MQPSAPGCSDTAVKARCFDDCKNVEAGELTRRIFIVRPCKSKSTQVIGPFLALFCMAAPICGVYAQGGVGGALTRGVG